jgi:hypothetical protein
MHVLNHCFDTDVLLAWLLCCTACRQELVSGKATPTTEELAGYEPPSDSSHAAAASAKAGVPYFWLNALCNQDTLAEEISSRDRQALAYCTSVKAIYPAGERVLRTERFKYVFRWLPRLGSTGVLALAIPGRFGGQLLEYTR